MVTDATDAGDDEVRLQEVDLVRAHEKSGSIVCYLRDAYDAFTGSRYSESVRFRADGDRLLAVGLEVPVDGRSDPDARALAGKDQPMSFAADQFEAAFGEDIDAVSQLDDGLLLRVYAAPGDGILVFERAGELSIARDDVEDLR